MSKLYGGDENIFLLEKIKILEEGLISIKNFGYKNSGHGYSCAKMAEDILKRINHE